MRNLKLAVIPGGAQFWRILIQDHVARLQGQGLDPHEASSTAAVLDLVTKTVIESARFASAMEGYAQLTVVAAWWARRRWAVGGCRGAGRPLAQRLVADGEMVLDVPARLAARVRVSSPGARPQGPARTTRSWWAAPASPWLPGTVPW